MCVCAGDAEGETTRGIGEVLGRIIGEEWGDDGVCFDVGERERHDVCYLLVGMCGWLKSMGPPQQKRKGEGRGGGDGP